MTKNHWDTPLGWATRCDKKRASAAKHRKEADKLDAEADALALKFEVWEQEHKTKLAELRRAV